MCVGRPEASSRLSDSAYAHIDFRDLIPGWIIHDTGLGKVEHALEYAHGVGGAGAVDAVRGDPGDGGIILCDPVELLLDLQDFATGCSDAQVIAGPGGGHTGYGHSGVDVHVAAIIVTYDLNGGVAFIAQILGTPLA